MKIDDKVSNEGEREQLISENVDSNVDHYSNNTMLMEMNGNKLDDCT